MKKETIKNIIILGLVAVIAVFLVRFAAESNKYAISSIVCAFDYDIDMVTVETCTGQLYSFYGIEDWEIGDRCAMMMDSKGTPSIVDDIILSVKYECK